MRDIYFRAWDKKLKELTNYSISGIFIEFYNKDTECWEIDREGERFILCQYTGLKDKNDREIYEGDILKFKGTPKYGVVDYCNEWGNI